jgi:hypothetical protein
MFRFVVGDLFDVRRCGTRPTPRLAAIGTLKPYIGRVRRRERAREGEREREGGRDNARREEWTVEERDDRANRRQVATATATATPSPYPQPPATSHQSPATTTAKPRATATGHQPQPDGCPQWIVSVIMEACFILVLFCIVYVLLCSYVGTGPWYINPGPRCPTYESCGARPVLTRSHTICNGLAWVPKFRIAQWRKRTILGPPPYQSQNMQKLGFF